jgi:hypothetical protein
MVVLLVEMEFVHHARVFQKAQGAVDSGQAELCILAPSPLIDLLGIQVALSAGQNAQDQLALGCNSFAGRPQAALSNRYQIYHRIPSVPVTCK